MPMSARGSSSNSATCSPPNKTDRVEHPPVYRFNFVSPKTRIQSSARWVLIVLKLVLIPVVLLSGLHFGWLLAALLALTSLFEYIAMRSIPHVSFFDEKIV